MSRLDQAERALWLRHALVQMTIRYGLAVRKETCASMVSRSVEAKRHERTRLRRFRAIHRLAQSLANLATEDVR